MKKQKPRLLAAVDIAQALRSLQVLQHVQPIRLCHDTPTYLFHLQNLILIQSSHNNCKEENRNIM